MERGREKFQKFKPLILIISKFFSLFSKKWQEKAFVRCRKKTGSSGLVIRYALLKNLAKNVGNNVSIQPEVYLFNIQNLSIGDNVSIHPLTYIEAYGEVKIGNDVSIAHGTTIMSVTHDFDKIDIPIKDQGITGIPIVIEDNVWIGAKATILGGNTIKKGSIIGAGAVVTKNVDENSIVAGVPAKKIRQRGNVINE